MQVSITKLTYHLEYAERNMRHLIDDRKALAEATAKNAADIIDTQAEIDNIKLAIETLKVAGHA